MFVSNPVHKFMQFEPAVGSITCCNGSRSGYFATVHPGCFAGCYFPGSSVTAARINHVGITDNPEDVNNGKP